MKVVTQATAIDGIHLASHHLPLIERAHPGLLRREPRGFPDPPQRITQGIGMAGQELLLPPVCVSMASIVALANLHRRPALLQEDRWFAEEYFAGPTVRGSLHK